MKFSLRSILHWSLVGLTSISQGTLAWFGASSLMAPKANASMPNFEMPPWYMPQACNGTHTFNFPNVRPDGVAYLVTTGTKAQVTRCANAIKDEGPVRHASFLKHTLGQPYADNFINWHAARVGPSRPNLYYITLFENQIGD